MKHVIIPFYNLFKTDVYNNCVFILGSFVHRTHIELFNISAMMHYSDKSNWTKT